MGRHVVDFLWADERLIVETDGWVAHRGRTAFREDRARDVDLKLLGYEVLRFTYEQVMREAASVARAIRSLLNRAAAA